MTSAEQERKYFWKLMQQMLEKRGNPFKIKPAYTSGKPRHYAGICNGNGTSLSVDFLATEGILRIELYIANNSNLYDILKENKETLEKILGFSILFTDGEKNEEVKWVKKEWRFEPYQWDEYRMVLEQALPDMIKFVEVFKTFVND